MKMIVSMLLAVLLSCFGLGALIVFFICLFRRAVTTSATIAHQLDSRLPVITATITTHVLDARLPSKQVSEISLSASELEKLPKTTGRELIMDRKCAICLDEIENEQPARLIPGCHHGFHMECADNWLSKHPLCPICRAKLDPQLLNSTD